VQKKPQRQINAAAILVRTIIADNLQLFITLSKGFQVLLELLKISNSSVTFTPYLWIMYL
jgi:hypothetical protein